MIDHQVRNKLISVQLHELIESLNVTATSPNMAAVSQRDQSLNFPSVFAPSQGGIVLKGGSRVLADTPALVSASLRPSASVVLQREAQRQSCDPSRCQTMSTLLPANVKTLRPHRQRRVNNGWRDETRFFSDYFHYLSFNYSVKENISKFFS